MKKVSLLFAMLLAFAVVAYAQSSDTQSGSSSSSSSPSASQGSSSSQGSSTTQPDTSTSTPGSSTSSQGSSTGSSQGTMGSQGSSTGSQGSGTYSSGSQGSSTTGGTEAGGKMKGEKTGKFKGCIRSEAGKFVLEDAHGRTYNLNTSEDLSAHVGHEVVVHGTESSAAASSAASTSGGAAKDINVTKVDHVSDTCKLGKHSKSEKGSSMKNPQ